MKKKQPKLRLRSRILKKKISLSTCKKKKHAGIRTAVTLTREKDFVLSLNHEISQPITAILYYAQAAKRMLAGREPKVRKILSYIINDGWRTVKIVRRSHSLLKKSGLK